MRLKLHMPFRRKKVYLKLLFVFIYSVVVFDNTLGNSFEMYKLNQLSNLPQNDVNCIYKDSKGFMWIGTLDGLHRYDGYTYKTYRVTGEENRISSNMIIAVDEDSYGNIWAATYGKGLCKLEPVHDKFTIYNSDKEYGNWNVSDDITCMMVDSKDVIWTGNWFGVNRLTFNDNMQELIDVIFIPLDTVPNRMGLMEVKTFHEDQNNVIWIGTNVSTLQLNNPYGQVHNIRFKEYPYNTEVMCDMPEGILVAGQQLVKLSALNDNDQWIYMDTLLYDMTSNAIQYYDGKVWNGNRSGVWVLSEKEDGKWGVSGNIKYNYLETGLSSEIVTSIYADQTNIVWIGTRGGGVNTLDLNPKKIYHFKNTPQPGSLSDNYIRCVYEDNLHNLWIGTEDGGVNLLRNSDNPDYANGFKHLTVADDIIGNRVYVIDEMLTPNSKKQSSLLWMGTSYPTHLVSVDPVSLKINNIPEHIGHLGFVFALESQGDSVLWVGTYGEGLWKFQVNSDGVIIGSNRLTPNDGEGYSISSYIIRSLMTDSRGNLWIGTDKGLNRIKANELGKRKPRVKVYTEGEGSEYLAHDYILQVFEAANKKIWVGTMGGGLIGFNDSRNDGIYSFTSITMDDGLPNNSIKSIEEDDEGYLWLASNNGLSKYDPDDGVIVNYDIDDGLQDNEFSEICSFKRSGGQMIFGGINGINVFYPHEIVKDTIKPKLFFNEFYILNKKVKPGEIINKRVVLEKTIEYTSSIKLKYRENSFSIGFIGLHYNAPQKNKYSYILDGFDDQWFSASANYRIAKYTNVPPGEYTFKVLSSNSDNVWNDMPIALEIRIYPPLYRSKLAMLVYLFLLLAIVYMVSRFYLFMSDRKKELLKSEIEKENIEELSTMKLQFFTNISHEFRTPLTLINAPLETLMSKNKTLSMNDRLSNYRLIKHNVNVMLRLINQLMDFRKLELNKLKLNARHQEINRFVDIVYKSFVPWATQKQIDFQFMPNFNKIKMWFDPDLMEKILYNLLSNAFKFTPRGGRIELQIVEDPQTDNIVISVKDTGLGIPDSEKPRIFERYYQPAKKHKQTVKGTGIGLALTKGLVEIHKGEIYFKSEKGSGTTFTVSLPMGDDHLNEEDKATGAHKKVSDSIVDIHPGDMKNSDAEEYLDANTKKHTLLIIEDNDDLRNFMAETFERNFQVLNAVDGMEGLKMCREFKPDIVISDVMMPNMDGIEFCRHLREDETISHIPVILLTAKDTEDSQIEGFETGADAYLSKPFSIEMLKTRVVSLIKGRVQLRMKYEKEVHVNPDTAANTPADTKFLENIIQLVEDNLSDSDFNVEKLAESYGVSRIYINRKIKALTGETSNQFIRNIRLKHAADLLRQNVLTVSEITWQVGYNDLRTFRSRFKEKFGISPSEYAKKYADRQTE